jgi:hypothetical protein
VALNPSQLVTLKGLESRYIDVDGRSLFPEATVRGWIHANHDRFKDRCVIKPGGKVFVDLDAFAEWLEQRRGAPRDRIAGHHRGEVQRRRQGRELHPVKIALLAGGQQSAS